VVLFDGYVPHFEAAGYYFVVLGGFCFQVSTAQIIGEFWSTSEAVQVT
jgi:hypothetical protein